MVLLSNCWVVEIKFVQKNVVYAKKFVQKSVL